MKRIKKTMRLKSPETNSSTTHSISISRTKLLKNTLPIKGNILIIPDYNYFDFSSPTSTNDTLNKIGYLIANCLGYEQIDSKYLRKLDKVIKQYTGVEKIKYKWADDFTLLPPIVDNSSIVNFKKVMESDEILKDFLFNDDSWLHLHSDHLLPDYDSIEGRKVEKFPGAIFTMHFPKIGRVDIKINEFDHKLDNLGELISEKGFKDIELLTNGDLKVISSYLIYSLARSNTFTCRTSSLSDLYFKNNTWNVIYTSYTNDRNIKSSYRSTDEFSSFVDNLSSQGLDIIYIPIELVSDEFGKIL